MNWTERSLKSVATVAVALVLAAAPAAGAPPLPYTITDLGLPAGGTYSEAYGLNDLGEVVGYWLHSQSGFHAFLYTGGAIHDIGSLGGDAFAVAINNASQVVGRAYTSGGSERAFLYDGLMQDILQRWGGATDINESGQIVGWSMSSTSVPYRAFIYSNGVRTDLNTLGGDKSDAFGINNVGQVVGHSQTAANVTWHAFLYADGQMSDLGSVPGSDWSMAYDIDDAGTIIGIFRWPDEPGDRAFLYTEGVMAELFPGSATSSYPRAINGAGQIVGIHGDRPFLYSEGNVYYLDTLLEPGSGWTLSWASGINNHGQIVGGGLNPAGESHAYLLTPIPEPATLALLLAGGLALLARKRK